MASTYVIKLLQLVANLFELAAIIVILLLALAFQIIYHELPCPLCLLQRIGFISIAFGFLLNFRFGLRPSHYAIVILSGLFTSFVALRQIALHVIPGTGAYGSPVLGLHLYTWAFIIAMTIVIITTLLLGIDRQYQKSNYKNIRWTYLTNLLFLLVTMTILANILSAILECGFNACPDNPIRYELINQQKGL